MARIRTIKPSFFTSTTVAELPIEVRLTFIGLWTHVDDEGRAVDDPRLVKAAIWPLDDRRNATAIEKDLAILAKRGLIERYTHDGHRYLRVRTWKEHQRINRPQESRLPRSPEEQAGDAPPPFTDRSVNDQGTITEPAPTDPGEITERSRPEGKGKEGKGISLTLETESPPEATGAPVRARQQPDDLDAAVRAACQRRPAIPGVLETPAERETAIAFAQRCARIQHTHGKTTNPDHAACLAWWALAVLDRRVVDEAITWAEDHDTKTLAGIAGSLRRRAEQADLDLPPWEPLR